MPEIYKILETEKNSKFFHFSLFQENHLVSRGFLKVIKKNFNQRNSIEMIQNS